MDSGQRAKRLLLLSSYSHPSCPSWRFLLGPPSHHSTFSSCQRGFFFFLRPATAAAVYSILPVCSSELFFSLPPPSLTGAALWSVQVFALDWLLLRLARVIVHDDNTEATVTVRKGLDFHPLRRAAAAAAAFHQIF